MKQHTDGIASPMTTLNHIIECGDSYPSNPCVGGALIPSYFSIRFPEKTMYDPHLKMISTPLVDDMDAGWKKYTRISPARYD